jgi:hypothetical protein
MGGFSIGLKRNLAFSLVCGKPVLATDCQEYLKQVLKKMVALAC